MSQTPNKPSSQTAQSAKKPLASVATTPRAVTPTPASSARPAASASRPASPAPRPASPAPRPASTSSSSSTSTPQAIANKARQVTLTAVETTRNSAEQAVRMGTEAVKELISSGAREAQKAQEKVFAISREGAESISRSADATARGINEMIAMNKHNVDAVVECGNITAKLAQNLGSELFNFANGVFSDNVELSKKALGCRNVNDFYDLQHQLFRKNVDAAFSESIRISEMLFNYMVEASEPINERVIEATDKLSKTIAA